MLKTKLHRPPLSLEHIYRFRLIDELNKNSYKPLSLVCAPAGYGKSMLASSWIEESKYPSAWLSLSNEENDYRTFIIHLTTAIQKIFPGKLNKTELLSNAPELPPNKLIAHSLINELDQIEEDFILVLDDYHLIRTDSIHELMNELLHYPPENLHVCILTRRDPPLRIQNLRAHNRMIEIRMKELNFSEEEVIGLFYKLHGVKLKKSIASSLQKRTEGWITALQLVSLASKNKPNIEKEVASFKGDLNTLSDFLMEEILSSLSDDMKELLFSTALLERFCLELTVASCMATKNNSFDVSKTAELFDQLINSNLFLIPLDNERKWFRYHHLFKETLVKHLGPLFNNEIINKNHSLAAKWFEDQELIGQAIHHFLAAGYINEAAELVEKHAHREFLHNVFLVEEWQKKLPPDLKEQRPGLLIIDAWIAYRKLHMERVPVLLEKINLLIKEKPEDSQLLAEINFFYGNFIYWMGAPEEIGACINLLKQSLVQIEKMPAHVISNIELLLNMALQKNGEKETLLPALENQILSMDKSNSYRHAYAYGSLAFVNLLCGKLLQTKKTASQMQIFTTNIGAEYLRSWSFYIQALANFHLFEVSEAKDYFKQVIDRNFSLDKRIVVDSIAAQALLYHYEGEDELANSSIDEMMNYADGTNDLQIHFVAKSAQMRLAILQGNYDLAFQWAETFTEQPIFFGLFFWQEVPWITLVKVLITKGTPDSLKKATGLIEELLELITASNLEYHLVEMNMLYAITLEKLGQSHKSMKYFKLSVSLADEQSCIRPFIEAGPEIQVLLEKLELNENSKFFMKKLTNTFLVNNGELELLAKSNQVEVKEVNLISFREKEIINLIVMGLRNKEIAAELYISENTVKKHISNIFQKIAVKNRVELVEKVRELNIS